MDQPSFEESSASTTGKVLSDESVARILEVLRTTLTAELSTQKLNACEDSVDLTIEGPWGMLVDESSVWKARTRLSVELYADMRGYFSDNVVREVLLAAAGVKLSRTCLSDAKLALLQIIAEKHDFVLVTSSERYLHGRDIGKGGASNSIQRRAEPWEKKGLRNVYVASDASVAVAGKMLEEAAVDEMFGMFLGIPACCRKAFTRFKSMAEAKQNDFIPFVLDSTSGLMPYDYWLNYPANYFGRCLISFFPCSFLCTAAANIARATFEMLAECHDAWAKSFLDLHQTNILYTEYDGLHLFRGKFVDGSIAYGPDDFISTEPTKVNSLLRRADRLEVRGKHQVVAYRELKPIGVIEGEDVAMCIFS